MKTILSKKSVKAEVGHGFGLLVRAAAPDLESDPTGLINETIGMGLHQGLSTTIRGMMRSANGKKHLLQGEA